MTPNPTTTTPISRKHGTLAQRFSRHIEKTDGCWLWTGAITKSTIGYGVIQEGGKGSRLLLAHRASWMIHFGEIPDDQHVLHRCDNPRCVNPSHLFLGSHQDNMDDRDQKMRQIHGEGHHKAKITERDVRDIRARYGGRNGGKLGREYGLTRTTIRDIATGKRWKHVD